MIKVTAISKVYNAGRPNEFTAVNGVSLTVNLGEVTVFKGPSGSGKNTFILPNLQRRIRR